MDVDSHHKLWSIMRDVEFPAHSIHLIHSLHHGQLTAVGVVGKKSAGCGANGNKTRVHSFSIPVQM